MTYKLEGIAGTTCPWIFTITPQENFPEIDLEESTISMRFSVDGVGVVSDLTLGDGIAVDDAQVAVTLDAVRSAELGDGSFVAELRIVPTDGVLYVARGQLKLSLAPASPVA